MNNRLSALDGLRAFAALGVLWFHTWTFHHNPRLVFNGFDLTSVMSLGGNGVDLFFVISGFCMYYFYAGNARFSYTDFRSFLKKRWIRLSPAFYTISLLYIGLHYLEDARYPVINSILTSLTYTNVIFPYYTPESILWSLTPEWEFYIIVPFLLIYQHRFGFKQTFTSITLFLLLIAISGILLLKSGSDVFNGHIVFRYFQFMWGILAGYVLLKWPNYQLKTRALWLIAAIMITYAGRILISKPILSLSTNYYNLFKLSGFTVMGAGFAGIIYLSVTSARWLKLILGNKALSFIGKISFSFYLLHGVVHRAIGNKVVVAFPQFNDITLAFITFTISVIVLIPMSAISFYVLENSFMARHKQRKASVAKTQQINL